jgi:hypothetical protein
MPSTMNPVAKLRQMQHDELAAALRAGKTGLKLLDDAENNVGNATRIDPQVLPAGQNYTGITQALANNSRVLNLTASSRSGQSITVVIAASRIPNQLGFVGPLTGIIEFGNGTTTTRIEFDVPSGPFIGSTVLDQPGDQPQDSGAVVQVPTSVLRAYARYDNAFLTPTVNGSVFGGTGSLPIANPTAYPYAPNLNTAGPLAVRAFSAYFGRVHTKLYKTQYLYVTDGAGTTSSFYYTTSGNPGPRYCIPPFAKSVRLIRMPQTAAMTLTLDDGLPGLPVTPQIFSETYAIASGIAPVIVVDGQKKFITIKSASGGANDAVSAVMLVYEIGF